MQQFRCITYLVAYKKFNIAYITCILNAVLREVISTNRNQFILHIHFKTRIYIYTFKLSILNEKHPLSFISSKISSSRKIRIGFRFRNFWTKPFFVHNLSRSQSHDVLWVYVIGKKTKPVFTVFVSTKMVWKQEKINTL